jgi:hypothetical protein
MNLLRLNTIDYDKALPWKKQILDSMRARVDQALQFRVDISPEPGGWWHQYVCPEHSLPLIFNLSSPVKHHCPAGDVCEGAQYDAAFRVFAHRHYAELARDCAVLFRVTAERRYLDTALEILSRYADLYSGYQGSQQSQQWMTAGRVFQQALTEAIWAVPLTQAFALASAACLPPQVEHIKNGLLHPLTDVLLNAHSGLVFKQNRLGSNYNAWLIAGLGHLGFALDDTALIQLAIEEPGGFAAHLNAAVLPDNMEHEGSPYYHNFVAWAYTLLAEAALPHGINLYEVTGSQGQSIWGMWDALALLMWADGTIPFLDDGNYWQDSSFDGELCEVYEIAFFHTEDERYAWLLNRAYQRQARTAGRGESLPAQNNQPLTINADERFTKKDTPRDSWAALTYANSDLQDASPPVMRSSVLPDAGLAMLHADEPQGLAALLRFGSCGGGHKHFDNLSVVLYPFSMDAGNPPYGMASRRTWYQQTPAHNTGMVNGRSQQQSRGKLTSWTLDASSTEAIASANDAYPGVTFSRKIVVRSHQITDEVSLQAASHTTFDWLLHLDVPLNFEDIDLIAVPQTPLYVDGPASLLMVVARAANIDGFRAVFTASDSPYRFTFSAPLPVEVFMAHSPKRGGIDMAKRYTLIVRKSGSQARFHAVYEAL